MPVDPNEHGGKLLVILLLLLVMLLVRLLVPLIVLLLVLLIAVAGAVVHRPLRAHLMYTTCRHFKNRTSPTFSGPRALMVA